MSEAANVAPFRARTVVLIVIAAVVALLAFVLMVAFLPQASGSGRDARGHALSVSGNGFAGLVKLTDAVNSHSLIVRDVDELDTRALLIVTPEPGADPKAMARLLARRDGAPTLVVLPKWWTTPIRERPTWARRVGTVPPSLATSALAKLASRLEVEQTPFVRLARPVAASVPRLARPRVGPLDVQQRLAGAGIVPLLADRDGHVVLGRVPHRPIYILADPDLIDNAGLADRWTARQGWQVIDSLMSTNELAFDVTLNGLATRRNPLRRMFEPPFLPVTLCILFAGLLAGLHGATRFGGPIARAPAVPPGKRQLVDNAAMLFRAARKEHRIGGAYAALTLEAAAQAAGAPARLAGDALEDWLDRAGPIDAASRYATLAQAARAAHDRDALVIAARDLHDWKKDRMR